MCTPELRQRLIDVLCDALQDNRQAWDLDADGQYRLRMPAAGEPERCFQAMMMKRAEEKKQTISAV